MYKVNLTKQNNEGEEEKQEAYFHSSNKRVIHMEEFDTVYDEAMSKIKQDFEAYIGEQSGWVLDEISSIDLNIARYKPIRGASYTETPRAIAVIKQC